MVTKITQNEETVTLTIELDKQTAQRLRFDETTTITHQVGDHGLIIRRADEVISDQEMRTALDEAHLRYGDTLRRLAE